MRYKADHIKRLCAETQARYYQIMDALYVPITFSGDYTTVDGSQVRMAVDDFKSVLSEIRRLK